MCGCLLLVLFFQCTYEKKRKIEIHVPGPSCKFCTTALGLLPPSSKGEVRWGGKADKKRTSILWLRR